MINAKGSNFELAAAAGSSVVIGDENSSGFKPTAMFSKWGGEAFVSLGIPAAENIQPEVVSDQLQWTAADRQANFYDRPDLLEGGLEVELVLSSPPASPDVPFLLDFSPELVWHYQPETLSKEEISFGGVRPDNCKGSYAIYHPTNKNNQYQTGKVAHLYRPTATDAKGNWIWGSWTLGVGVITASFDPQWLADAAYPVTIGPTIGYSSIGINTGGFGADQFEVQGPYTMPSAGTATAIQMYAQTASSAHVTYGIYNDSAGSPTTLLSNSGDLAVSGGASWNTIAIGGSLVNGNKYWPAFRASALGAIQYDTNSPPPDGMYNVASSYVAGSMPASAPSLSAFGGVLRSLYFDYTAGGGGGTEPSHLLLQGVS